jgi:hypothetical protein
MKHSILLFALLCATMLTQAQIGIGTSSPNPSAKLEISSTTQGLLPPRMTIILPENWTMRLVKIFNNLTINYEKGHKAQIQSVVQG